jgi:zinc transport system permease protein
MPITPITIMDSFLVNAFLAGIGVAAMTGPLGVFVVWRRMAYFGDAVSHAALLGIALGTLAGFDLTIGVIASCVAIASMLVALRGQRRLADDTILGVLAHSALAFGLIALAQLETTRIDIVSYLFGDVLAVSTRDVYWIGGACVVVLAILLRIWRPLIAVTVHEDLARVEGVPVARMQIAFMLLIAVITALAMKVVGMLLVTSLLIIPAAAARRFAKTPESMALSAGAIGIASVVLGLAGSLAWDLPSGPAIVASAVAIFAVAMTFRLSRADGVEGRA